MLAHQLKDRHAIIYCDNQSVVTMFNKSTDRCVHCTLQKHHCHEQIAVLKSNDHILEAHVHIHVKDKVSVTNYMDRRAKKGKVTKWLPFENYMSD